MISEQIAGWSRETFGGATAEEMSQHEIRLKRIREVSADYLAALKRTQKSDTPDPDGGSETNFNDQEIA